MSALSVTIDAGPFARAGLELLELVEAAFKPFEGRPEIGNVGRALLGELDLEIDTASQACDGGVVIGGGQRFEALLAAARAGDLNRRVAEMFHNSTPVSDVAIETVAEGAGAVIASAPDATA